MSLQLYCNILLKISFDIIFTIFLKQIPLKSSTQLNIASILLGPRVLQFTLSLFCRKAIFKKKIVHLIYILRYSIGTKFHVMLRTNLIKLLAISLATVKYECWYNGIMLKKGSKESMDYQDRYRIWRKYECPNVLKAYIICILIVIFLLYYIQ